MKCAALAAVLALCGCVPAASETDAGAETAQLVWSDEFDGDAINPEHWGFAVDCWGGGNEERQCYTDRPENAFVEDGKLVIEARKEVFSGPALPTHLRDGSGEGAQASKPFTSAKLLTKGKAAWEYGKIEVRARLPQGQGVWPAIWMLPQDDAYGTWAASGEIDILEAVNLGVECNNGCERGGENTILGTLHFGGQWPDNDLASTEITYPAVLDGFHTFAIIWEPGRFRWLVDGRVFGEKLAQDWYSTGSQAPNAPFDEPFYLILNLAIGGGLPEQRALGGVDEQGFPKRMEIDWVRVWQCSAQAASEGKCEYEGSE